MKIKSIALDIEALGTPEKAGYGVVIPNLGMVAVPDKMDDKLDFIYIRNAVQPQLDKGLTVDSGALHFWMASPENPADAITMVNAQEEVIKSLQGDTCLYYRWDASVLEGVKDIPVLEDYRKFFNPQSYDVDKVHIYGKGCHFDFSILQEFNRVMFGSGEISSYTSPQNIRTLEVLFSTEELKQRSDEVDFYVQKFIASLHRFSTDIGTLVLHHPLYDAAREALQVRWMLDKKK